MNAKLRKLIMQPSDEFWVITSVRSDNERRTGIYNGSIAQFVAVNHANHGWHIVNSNRITKEEYDALKDCI